MQILVRKGRTILVTSQKMDIPSPPPSKRFVLGQGSNESTGRAAVAGICRQKGGPYQHSVVGARQTARNSLTLGNRISCSAPRTGRSKVSFQVDLLRFECTGRCFPAEVTPHVPGTRRNSILGCCTVWMLRSIEYLRRGSQSMSDINARVPHVDRYHRARRRPAAAAAQLGHRYHRARYRDGGD